MSKQITVVGGNLYQIAAQEYGDPMGWVQIAVANGLSDPQVVGVVTLNIPSWNGDNSGVFPCQTSTS